MSNDLLRAGLAEEGLAAQLAAQDIEMRTPFGGTRDFYFEEAIVTDGQEVSVLAYAGVEHDPALPPPAPRQLAIATVLRDGGKSPLLIGRADGRGDDVAIGPDGRGWPLHSGDK
jgi:hypothetical protein